MYDGLDWKVTVDPAIEPITKTEVKTYARIDGTSEDDLLDIFIEAVRKAAENYLGKALIEQTITVTMDEWLQFGQSEVIELPRPPLISITEVRTLDEDGTETTYSSDYYYVRTNIIPGQLVLKYESTPPTNTERFHGGFEIEYKAGYGDEASDVPENIRLSMIEMVKQVYENRVTIADLPELAETLMREERVIPI